MPMVCGEPAAWVFHLDKEIRVILRFIPSPRMASVMANGIGMDYLLSISVTKYLTL